jgi:hypothetical protein
MRRATRSVTHIGSANRQPLDLGLEMCVGQAVDCFTVGG